MTDPDPNLPHFRIAVLDDVPSTLTMTKLVLETQLKCDVQTFSTAEAILDLDPANYPDLFLLDIVMDGMDGLELCRRLKAIPEAAPIPVIFLSAHGDCESRVTALQAGGVDYIDKPLYPEELLARIRSQIVLHHASAQLRRQTAEQQALLRILCHDLQNPVAAVDSILEMVTESPEESAELLPLAQCSIRSALDLIQHVRDYRNLIDRGQSYAVERVKVAEAFNEVCQINRPRARKKDLSLQTDVQGDLYVTINRVVLIHNILNNLVTNAIKFSRSGDTIHLRAWPADDGAGIHIQIEDHGIGMDPGTVSNLFDPEKNQSREGTGNEVGLGFGMPLVKRYVDLFDGTIEVDSHPLREDQAEGDRHGTAINLLMTGNTS